MKQRHHFEDLHIDRAIKNRFRDPGEKKIPPSSPDKGRAAKNLKM
jgi:hypothetical protein